MIGSSFADTNQPIRNLVKYPRPDPAWAVTGFGTGGAGNFSIQANAGLNGGPAGTMTWTTAATSGGASLVSSGGNGSVSDATIVGGKRYTASCYMKVNSASTSACVDMLWFDNTGAVILASRSVTPIAANTWLRVSNSVIAPANAVILRIGARINDLTGTTAGFTITCDGFMITEGTTLYPYADGATPGWKWTGTAGASASVGYPYTLESIAGPPIASFYRGGSDVAISIPPNTPLTLYGVGSRRSNPPLQMAGLYVDQTSANYRLVIQESAVNPNQAVGQFTVTDYSNVIVRRNDDVTDAPFVMAATRIDDTSTRITTGLGTASGVAAAGQGYPIGTYGFLRPANATARDQWDALHFFRAHDTTTEKRVLAWLARQYGGTIPAGY